MYSYQLYFRDFCELVKRSASSWLDNSVVRALHRYRRGHGLESRSVLTYFSGFLHATPPQVAYIIGLIFHCLKMFHQTSSITTWMTLDRKVGGWLKHRIRVLLFVTNPVGDSDFLFVSRSWHADYFIFTIKDCFTKQILDLLKFCCNWGISLRLFRWLLWCPSFCSY